MKLYRHGVAVLLSLFMALQVAHASQPASPSDKEDGPLVYVVRQGDTLLDISRRYLTSPSAIAPVQKLNAIGNDRAIPVGTRLRLPREFLRFRPVELAVVAFSGPVRIAGRDASLGATVAEGAVISTGPNGFVSVGGKFGGRFAIPSNSSARVKAARRYVLGNTLDIDIAIEKGRATAESPKLQRDDRLRLRTPVAVTAVRGTVFRVAYDDIGERNLTEVVEGSVGVRAGASAGTATQGFGIASSRSGVSPPEALLPPPLLRDPGKLQSEANVQFVVDPRPGEAGHRLQIARDAGFLDIVLEQVAQTPQVTFPELRDGRYFVRAQAISQSGLEGLSEAVTFRRKRLGAKAEAGQSEGGEGYLFQWLPEGSGQTFYAFQLWREGAADTPLIDETALSATRLELTGLVPATYFWRVAVLQAEPEDGLLKVWGPTQKLTISP